MTTSTKTPLAELFPGANFLSYVPLDQLRTFASQYDEMRYEDAYGRITFMSDSIVFTIAPASRHGGGFIGIIYDSKGVVGDERFTTETMQTIDEVFASLQVGWANTAHWPLSKEN